MSTAPKKIDREDVYQYIVSLIKNSRTGEVEISTSQLAQHFGIKGPSMDYHLKNLVENGSLIVSEKRGSYNRKIYKLPGMRTPEIVSSLKEDNLLEKLKEVKNKALGATKSSLTDAAKTKQAHFRVVTPLTPRPDPEPEVETQFQQEQELQKDTKKELNPNPQSEATAKSEPDLDPEKMKLVEELKKREKTLEEKINDFLERTKAVPQPQEILTKTDREILAVMNETIHQNILYLKDLEQQLSTVETKTLVQQLIDDRNQNLQKIEKLEQELKEAYRRLSEASQVQQRQASNAPDPQRIRMMHQVIAATVDQFVDLPNHAMALAKGEFRKNLNKEITNLIQYVLGLEK
jgi:DNA-binding transcriptional ArsR family regulator/Txe/YoeB family toxin of Txe-Axe toxin-antitoxin module